MRKGFAAILIIAIVIAVAILGVKNIFKEPLQVSPSQAASSSQNQVLASYHESHSDLEKYLTVEAALLGVSDNISLYFRDFASSNEVSIDPTRSWIPASTIKSFVVPEAFRQRRLGLIDFNDTVTISAENVVPTELETDDFPRLREGVVVTIGQLVEAMIEQSDNTAYNTLLDVLDRRNINLTLRNLGITETVVGEKLNLDDEQFAIDLKIPGRQPVTTTAKDLATLFNLMYLNKIPASNEMLSLFKKQKINNMIPALLPGNLVVAHKTGDWAPIYHDGGIVYKQNAPFVLSVFTNSNDPTVVSRIAQVAYLQNAESVGRAVDKVPENNNTSVRGARPSYFLAAGDITSSKVLAANNQQLPKITAADLGISANDLKSEVPQGINVKAAFIGPRSPFYVIKKFIDNLRIKLATSPEQKLNVEISLAKNRLAEFEDEIQNGNISDAQNLLEESEQNLEQSVVESTSVEIDDNNLLKIKQANDLHFETLSQIAQNLPDDKKEAFVNIVYQFVQNNKREVKPIVNRSLTATRSTSQEPIIGTVVSFTNKSATVKFDDGSTKEVVVSDAVASREFSSATADKKLRLDVNSKVAIVGQATKDGKIIPQFILRNIPKNIPDKKSGTVINIDSSNKSIKIITSAGLQEEVRVGDKTQIQSRDTTVSLEGIKAGSQVTVAGQPQNAGEQSASAQNNNKPPSAQIPISATTITVTRNDSGLKEQKSSPAQQGSKDQGKKEEQKNSPKKEEQSTPKKDEQKDSKKDDKK